MDPGLADGQFVLLSQMSGCCQMALAKQRQHLRGSNLRQAMYKALLARGPIRLSEQNGRTGRIALGQFQAGEQHVTGNGSVSVF